MTFGPADLCLLALAAVVWAGDGCTAENPSFQPVGVGDAGGVKRDVGDGLATEPAVPGPEDREPDRPALDSGGIDAQIDARVADAAGAGPDVAAGVPDALGGVVDLLTGLIGYWKMDEATGDMVAHDSSGHHHDGSLELVDGNKAWIPGRIVSALRMPNTPDMGPGVRVASAPDFAGLRRYTLAAWVRRSQLRPTNYYGIISRQLGNTDAEIFNLAIAKDLLSAYAPDRTVAGVVTAIGAKTTTPVGVWFHAAATFDGATLRLYQGGEFQSSMPWPTALPSDTTPLYIATNKNSAHHWPFEGDLDEVLLYSEALSGESIAALAAGIQPAVP